jgi:hypothetical protein
MSVTTTPARPVKKWRVIVFGIVAALLALVFLLVFFGAPLLLSPWIVLDSSTPTYHGEIHRWHGSIIAAFAAILIGGSLIGLVWQGQKRPLLAQFFLLGFFLFSLVQIVFRPGGPGIADFVLPVVIVGLFVLAYPTPLALVRLTPKGRWSSPLLVLSALTLLLLAPDIWHNLSLQITDTTSEHAQNWHWAIAAAADIAIIIAGFLAATKRPGWKVLGSLVGLTLVYLGVAALLLPAQAGSWGIIGSMLSGLGGLGYLAATLYAPRTRATPTQAITPETSLSRSK